MEEPQANAPPEPVATLRDILFRFTIPAPRDVTILVVDNDTVSVGPIRGALISEGYDVAVATDAVIARRHIASKCPQVLITADELTGARGEELAILARSVDPTVRVIFLTAGEGHAGSDTVALPRPVPLGQLARLVLRSVAERAALLQHREMAGWMADSVQRNIEAMREVTIASLAALTNALEARSEHFGDHSATVAHHAMAVARRLGLSTEQVDEFGSAGLVHDIGMIGIPDTLIDKPGKLTEPERNMVAQHPKIGASILEPMSHLGDAIAAVAQHHERWDGSGYPDGLTGSEISIGGQIIGIAEVWTGVVEDRAYRAGLSREDGMQFIRARIGTWFSPEVSEALLATDLSKPSGAASAA